MCTTSSWFFPQSACLLDLFGVFFSVCLFIDLVVYFQSACLLYLVVFLPVFLFAIVLELDLVVFRSVCLLVCFYRSARLIAIFLPVCLLNQVGRQVYSIAKSNLHILPTQLNNVMKKF